MNHPEKLQNNPYGFIYKTILPDGRFYIGQHKIISSKTLDPKYLGSGVILKDYIKSKGKQNIQREIIIFGYSREEMNWLESQYVTEETLNDPLCINLDKGGRNNFTRFSEVNERIGKTMREVRKEKKDIWKSRKGPENNKSKHWRLISPDGETFEFHGNIDNFCKTKNISSHTMKAAIRFGWIPRRGKCAGWLGFDLDTGNGTTRDTLNHGDAIKGINNPSHKSKRKEQK